MTDRAPIEQGSITQWIAGARTGDSLAGHQLWRRYHEQLVRMARQRLQSAPRRVADEEDVVVGAFEAFLSGVQDGRFPKLDDRDDLWQVLVMLTARKTANQLKHQARQKRGYGHVRGESVFAASDPDDDRAAGIDQIVGSTPSPEFAGQVSEECRRLLDVLGDNMLRSVAIAKMQGYQNSEIAEQFHVQTRTIERKLRVIRQIWSEAGAGPN